MEIANKFNEYFVNVGPNLASKIPDNTVQFTSYLTNSNIYSVFLDPVTEKQVENELNKLKEGKSCGYDEMSPRIMRKISKHILKPLTHIYHRASTKVVTCFCATAMDSHRSLFSHKLRETGKNFRPTCRANLNFVNKTKVEMSVRAICD